jgi:hypothetical protein
MVFKDVPHIFEDLVHVLVVMVFKGFHGLFCFSLFEVIHFKFVVIEKFEVVINFSIALLSGFDELTVFLTVIVSRAVGIVESIGKLGDVVDIGSFHSCFKVASHIFENDLIMQIIKMV